MLSPANRQCPNIFVATYGPTPTTRNMAIPHVVKHKYIGAKWSVVCTNVMVHYFKRSFMFSSYCLFFRTLPIFSWRERKRKYFYQFGSQLVKERKSIKTFCATTGKPTHLFRTRCASLDSV